MNTTLLAALALGGAALSVKKPTQNHNLMRLPSFRGIAEVRASLPGRMRLYLPAVSANREAAAEMKRQLEATGVVHEVALNFRLSTALIRYDETKVEAAVVQGAVLKLMGLTDALQKEPVSRIQSGLNTLMAAINHGLLEATNGLLDVRTLAGCALTFAGVTSLAVSGAAVPGAMTLLWWAASIWRRTDSGTNCNGADSPLPEARCDQRPAGAPALELQGISDAAEGSAAVSALCAGCDDDAAGGAGRAGKSADWHGAGDV